VVTRGGAAYGVARTENAVMSPVWIVSIVLQWLVIAVLCLVVLSLLRQIGALALRADARVGEEGPGLYSEMPVATVPLKSGGTTFQLGGGQDSVLAVILSPGRATSIGVERALRSWNYPERIPMGLSLLILLDLSEEASADFLADAPFGTIPVALLKDAPADYRDIPRTPYAVGISPGGVVVAQGRPRSTDQLEEIAWITVQADLQSGRRDAVNAHDWGESAPFWESQFPRRGELDSSQRTDLQ
jgi:hypothetical protein